MFESCSHIQSILILIMFVFSINFVQMPLEQSKAGMHAKQELHGVNHRTGCDQQSALVGQHDLHLSFSILMNASSLHLRAWMNVNEVQIILCLLLL